MASPLEADSSSQASKKKMTSFMDYQRLLFRKDQYIWKMVDEVKNLRLELLREKERFREVMVSSLHSGRADYENATPDNIEEDSGSDESIELDDEGHKITQPDKTPKSKTRKEMRSMIASLSSLSIRAPPTGAAPQVNMQRFTQVVDENIRMKKLLICHRLAWRRDNAVGRATIEKLQQDVVRLKWENSKKEKEISSYDSLIKQLKDLTEENEKLKMKVQSAIDAEDLRNQLDVYKQQALTFKEDYDLEFAKRNNAVRKLENALHQFENLLMQNRALQEENMRRKARTKHIAYPLTQVYTSSPVQMRAGPGIPMPAYQQQHSYELPNLVMADSIEPAQPEPPGFLQHGSFSPVSKHKRTPSDSSSECSQRTEPVGSDKLRDFRCQRCEKECTSAEDLEAHEKKCFD